jgi:adenosylcobinamide kinase/adenosylcobinamide-phosphate guanylyltransferase
VNKKLFVLGGCRSGKSQHALDLAEPMPAEEKIFIATCVPQDEEMKQRVNNHQKQRGRKWQTVEAPVKLPQAITDHARENAVVVVDCLTLWMNNLLMEHDELHYAREHYAEAQIDELTRAVDAAHGTVVLVSNEVGTGIVPENKLARTYRDLIGTLNQAVAKAVDRVVWVVAGIAVTIKG